MTKTRTQVAIAGAGFALVLASCSDTDTASSSGPFEGETLNVLMVQEEATEDLRDTYVPEFEAETGMTVNIELLPESGMESRMLLSLSQEAGEFDVVETGARSWSQLVGSGWIRPLNDYMEQDSAYAGGFKQALLESLQMGGETYAMPYVVGSNILFYNKAMFKEAGLDPNNPPNTMEELITYAERLHSPDEGRNGVVFRGTREGNANSFSWIMMWFLNGGRWVDDNGKEQYEDALGEPEALKTAEQYQRLAQFAPDDIGSYNFMEAQVAMQQGEAAMWLDAAQLGPALEDPAQSNIAGDVGYHVMEGQGDDYVVGPLWAFSITNTAEDPDAAWEFIKFITGKDVTLKQAIEGTNGSPARTDVLRDERIQEAFVPEFASALDKAVTFANPEYSPLIPEGTDIRSSLSLSLSEIISGQVDPKDGIRNADDAASDILSD